jgi:DNA mismatch repair protein MutS
VKNFNVAVREWGDHIVFLRKIQPGGADRSYGIQVARLAGLPAEVVKRAKEILSNLEANELTPDREPRLAAPDRPALKVAEPTPQLELFSPRESRILDAIRGLDVNGLTPVDALKKLDELKRLLEP